MTKVGEHVTLDFIGVKKVYSQKFYEKIIYKIAKLAKVEILGINSHKFEPQGVTALAMLAESHLSIHTWPETGVAKCDIFTCGDKCLPEKAVEYMKEAFKATEVTSQEHERI